MELLVAVVVIGIILLYCSAFVIDLKVRNNSLNCLIKYILTATWQMTI